MIDINKKYRTRRGDEVRIYATDGSGEKPIHGAFFDTFVKGWISLVWTEHGKVDRCLRVQPLDLIEVRPRHKRTVWLHVFENSTVCATEEAYYEITNRIACIKIELDFEEGEGL